MSRVQWQYIIQEQQQLKSLKLVGGNVNDLRLNLWMEKFCPLPRSTVNGEMDEKIQIECSCQIRTKVVDLQSSLSCFYELIVVPAAALQYAFSKPIHFLHSL